MAKHFNLVSLLRNLFTDNEKILAHIVDILFERQCVDLDFLTKFVKAKKKKLDTFFTDKSRRSEEVLSHIVDILRIYHQSDYGDLMRYKGKPIFCHLS